MDAPNESFSEKLKARKEAERQVALYEKKSMLYLKEGELRIDDEIDFLRGRVADVIYHAEKAGAEVSDLIEKWMNVASRIINAKKKLR